MKIISGIIGGAVFLLLVLTIIFKVGLEWEIALALCTATVAISILVIRYTDIRTLKFGSFSANLAAPNPPTVENKTLTKPDDTLKFSPIVIANVETMSQDFKNFIVEIRRKDDKISSTLRTASGIKTGLYWKMEPLVFEHTITGIEYEIRICVQNINGEKSQYSEWVRKIAG